VLYVTTRNQQEPVTAVHPLKQNRGMDGGFWIPYHKPQISAQQIADWKAGCFNQTMAQMLNLMFGTKLTAWDIDFCIGRYPVRVKELAGKVIIVEPWHNPQWTFENMVSRLNGLVGGTDPLSWPRIAVRIAVMFSVYGELLRRGIIEEKDVFDVSVLSGDFTDPISVWYARDWGLPVGNVICSCNENNSVWNLICHGELRTDVQVISTCVPAADVALPEELERLIAACADRNEVGAYLECCRSGRMYIPGDTALQNMRQGLYVSVVSSNRLSQTIGGVYASHGYVLSPEGALVYAGLQDYRAKKGKLCPSLVMTSRRPATFRADTDTE